MLEELNKRRDALSLVKALKSEKDRRVTQERKRIQNLIT
jgi:hypothetical protein